FAQLVHKAKLAETLREVTAVAISPAALQPLLQPNAELPFKAAIAAERPTRQAVLDEVDRLAPISIQGSIQEQAPPIGNPMTDPTPSTPPPVETRTVVMRRGLGFFGSLLGGMLGTVLLLVAVVASLPLWPHFLLSLWRGGEAPTIDAGQIRADAGT